MKPPPRAWTAPQGGKGRMENSAGFQTARILKMANEIDFWQACKDFLADLNYTRGYSLRTCYKN
jgi:hypothetical protein